MENTADCPKFVHKITVSMYMKSHHYEPPLVIEDVFRTAQTKIYYIIHTNTLLISDRNNSMFSQSHTTNVS